MKYDPTKTLRTQRRLAAGQKCPYCRRPMLAEPVDGSGREATVEHVVTQGKGGGDHHENLIFVCKRCNNLRGEVPYEVFVVFARVVLRQYPDAPRSFLVGAMREFVYALAEGGLNRRDYVNHAVRMSLLRLASYMERA